MFLLYLILALLLYGVVSGLALSNPNTLYGTTLQFSIVSKILIVLLTLKLLDNPLIAAPISILLIYTTNGVTKLLVKRRESQFIRYSSFIALIMKVLATPFNSFLNRFTHFMEEEREEREIESIEEITEGEGEDSLIDAQEKRLLKNIVALSSTEVGKIMRPRIEVVALESGMGVREVMERAEECGYSRLPVYENSLDNIKGFLYVKDLLGYLKEQREDYDWRAHIREAYFVPANKKTGDLLEEFRQKKIHLAMVVDEYGGTDGIVTLEDILEEIVGEISDETDRAQ